MPFCDAKLFMNQRASKSDGSTGWPSLLKHHAHLREKVIAMRPGGLQIVLRQTCFLECRSESIVS